MVLCPFVYLLMRYDTEPLALQPSEVHSAHWVSLRALLSPDLQSSIGSDVSGRFGRPNSPVVWALARVLFGRVLLKAIKLVPTESVYSNSNPEFLPPESTSSQHASSASSFVPSLGLGLQRFSEDLILWGLTLGKQPQPLGVNRLFIDGFRRYRVRFPTNTPPM